MGSGHEHLIAVPGIYADLSHTIAFITVSMAVMALIRLRPALKNFHTRKLRKEVLHDAHAGSFWPFTDE